MVEVLQELICLNDRLHVLAVIKGDLHQAVAIGILTFQSGELLSGQG